VVVGRYSLLALRAFRDLSLLVLRQPVESRSHSFRTSPGAIKDA
jgi:hypothetical protein